MTITPPSLPVSAQQADIWRALAADLDTEGADNQRTIHTGVVNVYRAGGRVTSIGQTDWTSRNDHGAETRTITVRATVSGRRLLVTVEQVRLTRHVSRRSGLVLATAGAARFLSRRWLS